MKTYNNANEATTATETFVNNLTVAQAKTIIDFNEPIISMYKFCCEIGLGGWYYMKSAGKQMCSDVIMVAILNKLATKETV